MSQKSSRPAPKVLGPLTPGHLAVWDDVTGTLKDGGPSGGGGGGGGGGGITTNGNTPPFHVFEDLEVPQPIEFLGNFPIVTAASVSQVGYWAPLTDGDVNETDLIFASGEAVMVFVPAA